MQWAPIPGFEGRYEASDTGLIRSLDRVIETRNGSRWKPGEPGTPGVRRLKGRILKPGPLGNTLHQHVVLEGRVDRTVHSLVLEAFVGPCPPGMEARHADDNPLNNNLNNLSWGTRSENSDDSIRNEKHFHSGLTHCKRGHELTPENLQQHGDATTRGGTGRRTCLACRRERQSLYKSGGRVVPEGLCPNGHPKIPENRISNGEGRTRCKLCASASARARHLRRLAAEQSAENIESGDVNR